MSDEKCTIVLWYKCSDPESIIKSLYRNNYMFEQNKKTRYFVLDKKTKAQILDSKDAIHVKIISDTPVHEMLQIASKFDRTVSEVLNREDPIPMTKTVHTVMPTAGVKELLTF